MKVIVMFDLPTGNKKERRSYALFRKSLKAEGFSMLQFSVYAKTCLGVNDCMTAVNRVRGFLPSAGSVTAFIMTEKQYEDRQVLIEPMRDEGEELGSQLSLVF